MPFRSLILVAAGLVPLQTQDPAAPAPARAVVPEDPDFEALRGSYDAALAEYDDRRIRRTRGQSKDPEPPHPAPRFLAQFQALAERGSGRALGWIVENARLLDADPAARRKLVESAFPKLLERHADEIGTLGAIEGLRQVRTDLGDEAIVRMAAEIAAKSTIDEIVGEAKVLQAWALTEGETTTDARKWADATEIYRDIVYSVPRTRAARHVAEFLYRPLQQEFYEAERKWVDALIDLQARGRPPEEWPRQPMHEFVASFQPLAAADHRMASLFVNRIYPAYEQVERQGVGFACSWLVGKIGEYFMDDLDGPWNRMRTELFAVVCRQFPTERWVPDMMKKLRPQVGFMPPDALEPAVQALLEKSTDARVRAGALWSLASSLVTRGDQESYRRAVELFARVRAEYPEDELSQPSEDARAALAAVLPGAPAIPTQVPDATGLPLELAAYRGRVVLLEFWSIEWPAFREGIPARAALHRALEGRPFSLVGINLDDRRGHAFTDLLSKHGIPWRCASTSSTNPLVASWAARKQPCTILVDAQGIIRARDLPWSEMAALAETLVAQTERGAAGPIEPK